jgi:hypothetical protein
MEQETDYEMPDLMDNSSDKRQREDGLDNSSKVSRSPTLAGLEVSRRAREDACRDPLEKHGIWQLPQAFCSKGLLRDAAQAHRRLAADKCDGQSRISNR